MPRSRSVAVLVAATLLFAACGDDSAETTTGQSTTTKPAEASTPEDTAPTSVAVDTEPAETAAEGTVVVIVASGSVQGPGRVEVSTGDRVEVMLTSDVTDEVHVHGIDERFEVVASEPVTFAFVADIPGVYEIELESAGTLLFELAVR